ncbi:hypothetical protein Smp_182990 [Schistosoma mansoni]|nr:hypothetical protein Smp_190340 [Schistosoma mansoni]XP_018649344.1 hypothetical protein Smp_185310 [Schistosoma mansoni]XP_018649347.1 hypothetical protein Smp_182990 [Schistosoma mansoni]|eukprot:XP_018649343.1 hypothetical protein Smp_190340 [Schistosoma mansoni]
MDKRYNCASIQSQPQETTHRESTMHGAAERLLAITNRHSPNNTNTHSYKKHQHTKSTLYVCTTVYIHTQFC